MVRRSNDVVQEELRGYFIHAEIFRQEKLDLKPHGSYSSKL